MIKNIILFICLTISFNVESADVYQALVIDGNSQNSFNTGEVETILIDRKNGSIGYSSGTIIFDLLKCSNKKWVCISDGNLQFAIEKNWNPQKKHWSYLNVDYSVIEDHGDNSKNVYFIRSTSKIYDKNNNIPKTVFVYSKKKGIVAFIVMIEGTNKELIQTTYVRVE